jgi:formate-dependent nitrite reductase membrane component NrfD
LLFLIVTLVLLVADLKKPSRFLYVLLRPQWQSWLVRGAYILVGYSAVLMLWLAAHAADWSGAAGIFFWPGVVLAVPSAVYTAFLLAQAKGRDLWQNALLSVHLLAHAVVAGGAVWLLIAPLAAPDSTSAARNFMAGTVVFSLLALLGELATTPPTDDARRAIHMIVGRPMGVWFWAGGVGAGHIAPLVLLLAGGPVPYSVAEVLELLGLGVIERLWVLAPQRVPLS